MREKRKVQVVRCLEHMKQVIGKTIERMHEGALDPATAQLVLWDELTDSLADIERGAFDDVLVMRVSHDDHDPPLPAIIPTFHEKILAMRREGPLDGPGPCVLYLALRVKTARAAYIITQSLQEGGVKIRSWQYGCHRSSNPHLKRNTQA